jgi:hypothetical protein
VATRVVEEVEVVEAKPANKAPGCRRYGTHPYEIDFVANKYQ